jgi:hypothetical protein
MLLAFSAKRSKGQEANGIEDALVDALLADVGPGGAKDALPLLAFTLERLYGEYHAGGHLRLSPSTTTRCSVRCAGCYGARGSALASWLLLARQSHKRGAASAGEP